MKFFSDFLFCYLPTAMAAEEEEATSATNADPPLLFYGNNNNKRDAKQSRLGSGSAVHWKPGLSAIAENGVVSFAGGQNERKTLQHEKKALTKGKSMAKACTSYSHNNGNKYTYNRDSTMHIVLPAFSPTPFPL